MYLRGSAKAHSEFEDQDSSVYESSLISLMSAFAGGLKKARRKKIIPNTLTHTHTHTARLDRGSSDCASTAPWSECGRDSAALASFMTIDIKVVGNRNDGYEMPHTQTMTDHPEGLDN
jgi:hypothetical protein